MNWDGCLKRAAWLHFGISFYLLGLWLFGLVVQSGFNAIVKDMIHLTNYRMDLLMAMFIVLALDVKLRELVEKS